jgi:hypothetical protein
MQLHCREFLELVSHDASDGKIQIAIHPSTALSASSVSTSDSSSIKSIKELAFTAFYKYQSKLGGTVPKQASQVALP